MFSGFLVAGIHYWFPMHDQFIPQLTAILVSVAVASLINLVWTQRDPDKYFKVNMPGIFKRKHTEIELTESNRNLRGLYELSPLGIALTDMQGRYIEFNEAFRKICGYTENELKQLDYWDLTPEKYMDEEKRQLELLESTGHYGPYEKEYIQKGGQLIQIELNGILIAGNDGRKYIWSIVKDNTDVKRKITDLQFARQKTEIKLEESEARFASTIEQAAVGIALVTLDGRWLQVNNKICQIVGYSRHELLQKTFQEITHPDDLNADLGFVSQMLSGAIETYTMDKRYIRKNGSIVWIRLTVSLHKKTDNSPDYFISVIEDISMAKEAESELKKLRSRAERLLSQQVVTQTVMALAHDLNQPLNAAGSYSEAAMRLLQQDTLDRQRLGEIIKFNVTQIQKAGDVLRKLIQSVNRNDESDECLDLVKSVHESILLFKDESYGAPPDIEVECKYSKIDVVVKKIFLRKALINLFRNARQAMDTSTDEKRIFKIWVRIELDGDCAGVTIIDNGTGITEEVAKELFKPFFTTKADGIGMGLAISRAMIESCGGKLWYKPVGGKTAFHISLPHITNAGLIN